MYIKVFKTWAISVYYFLLHYPTGDLQRNYRLTFSYPNSFSYSNSFEYEEVHRGSDRGSTV